MAKPSTGRIVIGVAVLVGLTGCPGAPAIPEAPTLDAAAGPTNQNPFPLTGRGTANAAVEVRGGAESVVQGEVAEDGTFSVPVPLRPDATNTLIVSLSNSAGEGPIATLEVVHDGTAPETPALSAVTSPTRRTTEKVRGTTEPGAAVRVTGGASEATGTADAAGAFELDVALNTSASGPVTNELSVVAADAAGNVSGPATATVVFDGSLPVASPTIDAPASPTNAAVVTLTGTADPGVGLTVVGDATAAGTADGTGAFSLPVTLKPNQKNTLFVFAVGAGQTSSPATVEIVHDDVAPGAPVLDELVSPTGASTVEVSGTAEPRARVDVTGAATPATGNAGDDGTFTIRVTLRPDVANELSATATDLAGNTGPATTATVTQDPDLDVPVALDPVVSPTQDTTVTLTGTTQAAATVNVAGGAAPATTTSDGAGRFSVDVTLTPNTRNELRISRTGGTTETAVAIVHDDVAPAVPTLNPIASPTNRRSFDVAGATEPLARVAVAGGTAGATGRADATGRFAVPVTIAENATATLVVVASDAAGNASGPAQVEVRHSGTTPDAPILADESPLPTSAATYTVSGRVTQPAAGTTVTVTGGAATATGPADPATGAFAVEVTLTPNAANELEVTSKTGELVSAPVIVVVVHDSVAPAAPDAAKITIGPQGPICAIRRATTVSGAAAAVESRATVRIVNTTANGSALTTTATDEGSFSVPVSLCPGDVLRFVAIDAAGNESEATAKTME